MRCSAFLTLCLGGGPVLDIPWVVRWSLGLREEFDRRRGRFFGRSFRGLPRRYLLRHDATSFGVELKRHCLGFDFAQTSWCFGVGESTSDVWRITWAISMKKCLVWKLSKRVNCCLALAGLFGQVSYVALSFF
jgi:hypothetical protein